MPTKVEEKAKTRIFKFIGTADKVDVRALVGFKPDDDSEEARKFIFYPLSTKSSDKDALKIATDQWTNGVEMSEDQAVAILTSEFRPWGFADVTGLAGSKDTIFEKGVLDQMNVEGAVVGSGSLLTPLEPQGNVETGYPLAEIIPEEADKK